MYRSAEETGYDAEAAAGVKTAKKGDILEASAAGKIVWKPEVHREENRVRNYRNSNNCPYKIHPFFKRNWCSVLKLTENCDTKKM